MYNGIMSYVPRTKIRQTVTVQENRFIRDAIDRGNMKLASIAKNIITEYGVSPDEIRPAAFTAYAQKGHLLSELNSLKTEIVVTYNIREWRHFFKLRCSKAAHPQMREVAKMAFEQFYKYMPELFEDIKPYTED